jgi:hypothetical protein
MIASMELGRELAILQPGVPVLSLHVCTDPREPANTAATPKWLLDWQAGRMEQPEQSLYELEPGQWRD